MEKTDPTDGAAGNGQLDNRFAKIALGMIGLALGGAAALLPTLAVTQNLLFTPSGRITLYVGCGVGGLLMLAMAVMAYRGSPRSKAAAEMGCYGLALGFALPSLARWLGLL